MLQAVELTIRLHPDDDVVIARIEIPTGTLLTRENVRAAVTIPAVHNLAMGEFERDYAFCSLKKETDYVSPAATFQGTESVLEAGERIFRLILETASGKQTKSELLGFGEDEFAPWVVGATL